MNNNNNNNNDNNSIDTGSPDCASARFSKRQCIQLMLRPRIKLSVHPKHIGRLLHLDKKYYVVHRVKKSPDSLFLAAAHAMTWYRFGGGIDIPHERRVAELVREHVVAAVEKHPKLQETARKFKSKFYQNQFDTKTQFWSRYRLMMLRRAYGGPAELMALAKVLKMAIHVYSPAWTLVEHYNPRRGNGSAMLIRLMKTGAFHYDAIIPRVLANGTHVHRNTQNVPRPRTNDNNNGGNQNQLPNEDSSETNKNGGLRGMPI